MLKGLQHIENTEEEKKMPAIKQQPKKRQAPPAPAPAQTAPEPLPEWLTKMPEEREYCLWTWEPEKETDQTIALTRAEYIALKQYVAQLRGYPARLAERQQRVAQADLQRVLDLATEMDRLAASIRRRLEAGAQVEPGPLGTISHRWEDMPDGSPTTALNYLGLEIGSAADMQKWGAELSAAGVAAGTPGRTVYSHTEEVCV
jgi:hypothetical protein